MGSIQVPSLLLLVALSSISTSSVSALKWTFDGKHASCDGDPFQNVYVTASCSSKSACNNSMCTHIASCGLGDVPDITGRLTAVKAFANNQVAVKPCLSGICSSRDTKIDGRICDWIKPINDQECGQVGAYQFDYLVELPDVSSHIPEWLFDMLTLKIQVQKGSGCQTEEGNVADNDGYQLPYPLMGLGAVAGLAVALCRDRRRRRIMSEQEDEDEDDDTIIDDDESYIEMGSRAKSKSAAWSPRNNSPETVSSIVSSQISTSSSLSSVPESGYRPPTTDLLPPGIDNGQVTLEDIRGWYDQLGIAIV